MIFLFKKVGGTGSSLNCGKLVIKLLCNYCQETEHEVITKFTRFEMNNILKCKGCGLVSMEMEKDKDKDAIESFYSSEYRKTPSLPTQSAEEHFFDEVTQHDTKTRVSFISKYVDINGKKVLEIGSASGSLLNKLSEYHPKEVVGVELGKKYADYSRKKGFKIFTKSIEYLNLSDEFDIIVSFHTLEHVFDPMSVFKATYKALKPGGCFLGEVPNQDDWRIKIFNDEIIKRFHYDPNHYYYFSPKTLENYLKTYNFRDLKFETVERYNSLLQLRNIICRKNTDVDIEKYLTKFIFPINEEADARLPNIHDEIECEFNSIFEKGVNSELIGNCLRWIAHKK